MNRPKLKIIDNRHTWKKITMPIHIVTLMTGILSAAAACAAYVGIVSPNERFVKIETRQEKVDTDIGNIKVDTAYIKGTIGRIEQKVDDLRKR